ncbi:MAG TPA: thiamine phosphate synthase [Candidatus Omnitrophota bacterium]|nr:thiamine phosphate synthase [Candidatus Omnitrophota bacterium]HQQ05724.1 thiamine phosphate synthase [Candidatus Omnitrophota bacterium]
MRSVRGFYFITGGALSRRGDVADVRVALRAGVRVVQYRDKDASSAVMYRKARVLKRLCGGALFIVNDRIDIAMAAGADGVHLGQDDMPLAAARQILGKRKIIGISVRTVRQARQAVAGGADYLGVGPVFTTATKADAGRPRGLGLIKRIRAEFDIPLVAIGGISLDNASSVIAAGADALCAISAIVARRDIAVRIKAFQKLFGPIR